MINVQLKSIDLLAFGDALILRLLLEHNLLDGEYENLRHLEIVVAAVVVEMPLWMMMLTT